MNVIQTHWSIFFLSVYLFFFIFFDECNSDSLVNQSTYKCNSYIFDFLIFALSKPWSVDISVSSSERSVSGKERRGGDVVQSHRALQQEEHHSAEVCVTPGFFTFAV